MPRRSRELPRWCRRLLRAGEEQPRGSWARAWGRCCYSWHWDTRGPTERSQRTATGMSHLPQRRSRWVRSGLAGGVQNVPGGRPIGPCSMGPAGCLDDSGDFHLLRESPRFSQLWIGTPDAVPTTFPPRCGADSFGVSSHLGLGSPGSGNFSWLVPSAESARGSVAAGASGHRAQRVLLSTFPLTFNGVSFSTFSSQQRSVLGKQDRNDQIPLSEVFGRAHHVLQVKLRPCGV